MKVPKTPPVQKEAPTKRRTFNRKNFNSLLLNGASFQLGDVVIIKEATDERSYGRILRIWKEPGEELQAFIHLRWFYKPVDVFDTVPTYVGTDELFESDHEQDVYVQTISGKIRVVTLEEYLHKESSDKDVYFTRAKYSPATKQLDPPTDEWERVCACQSILSPSESYIACAQCKSRSHPTCAQQAEGAVDWTCENCSGARK